MSLRTTLLILAHFVLASGLAAQTVVTLGTGPSPSATGGNAAPFKFPYRHGRYQICWTAQEINLPTGATITQVRASKNNGTLPQFTNLRLRMAHTNTVPQLMSRDLETNYTGTLVNCIGPANYTPTSIPGYAVFTLTTPFQYNGISGLLMDFSYDDMPLTGGWYVDYVSSGARNRTFAHGYYNTATGSVDVGGDWLMQLVATPNFGVSTFSPLAVGAVAVPYPTTNLNAANGATPYTWQTPVSGLPPGLAAAQVSNQLRITGTPSAAGDFTFTVTVTDSASRQAQKTFSIKIIPAPAALPFVDDFSADKGWQLGSTWERGPATYYYALQPTRKEPSADATPTSTDNMILGDSIGGDYGDGMATTFWATSPLFNCSSAQGVQLRFKRWLGVGLGDTVKIQVGFNGANWTDVYNNALSQIIDIAWGSYVYDISSVAAGKMYVQVRFGVGNTDPVDQNIGWCIDDFEVYEAGPALEVREGGTTGTLITDNQAAGGQRDIGNVQIGVQSTPLTIALTNNGAAAITFGTFTKSGANPGDFYVNAGSLINPLPVGQSTTFTITFYAATSSSPGARSATISVPHNAISPGGGSFEINVTANATSAPTGVLEIRLGSVTGSVIAFNQPATGTARDFGSRDISAGPSAQITIFVLNVGTGAMNLSAPVMGGTWWNQYTLDTTGFLTSLNGGQNTSFKVAFDPAVVQNPLDALVRLAHTDTTQTTPFDIPVTGAGTSASGPATMNIREGGATGTAITHNQAAAGTGREFGSQMISAGPTAALTIFIQNTGGMNLTLGTPALAGAQPGEFVLNTAGFSTSLASSASTTFTIAFDPTTLGPKAATVTLTHNDSAQSSPFIINVTGTGVNASGVIGVKAGGPGGTTLTNPAPATGPLNFGGRDIAAGPSATLQIYIENTGTAPLTLGMPTLSGAAAGEFVLDTTGFSTSVAAPGNTSFTVAFDPSTIGAKTASMSFTHNGIGTTSPFVINVAGSGVLNSPLIEVRENGAGGVLVASGAAAASGGGRDLGSIDTSAGATLPVSLTILNTGTQPLNLGTPSMSGPNAADFVLVLTGFSSTVSAGGSTQIDVTFDPANVGAKDANIEFTHNDASASSPFIVPIIGLGTSPTGVVITTGGLPGANQGKPYAPVTLTAALGTPPYSWSLYKSSLPAGLSLSSTGVLDGTPVGPPGLFNVTIRVADSTGGTNEKQFAIAINGDLMVSKGGGNGGCTAGVARWEVIVLLVMLLLATAVRRRKA